MRISHFIRSPSNLLVLRITFNDDSVRELEVTCEAAAQLSDVLYSYSQMAFESKKPAPVSGSAPVLELAPVAHLRCVRTPAPVPDCEHDIWVHRDDGPSYCEDCGLVCAHKVFTESAIGTLCKQCNRPFEAGR